MASLTQGLGWSLAVTAVLAAVGLVAVYLLLPPPASSVPLTVLPWWDIPVRMLATLALVTAIVLSADLLGPQLSGIIATFPVIVTVVGAFTHHQSGPDAVRRMLRSLTLSLLAFVAFFFVVGATMPAVGLAVSFLLATAAALPVSAALLVLGRLGVLRCEAHWPASSRTRAPFGRPSAAEMPVPPAVLPRGEWQVRGSGTWSSCSARFSAWRAARRSSSSWWRSSSCCC
jgi:hypothetical protein